MTTTNQFPETIRIGILVYDGFEPIDVWALQKLSRFHVLTLSESTANSFSVRQRRLLTRCTPGGNGQSETGKEGRAR